MLVLLYDKNRLDGWCRADFFSDMQYAQLYFKIETTICKEIMPYENKSLKAINFKVFSLKLTSSLLVASKQPIEI